MGTIHQARPEGDRPLGDTRQITNYALRFTKTMEEYKPTNRSKLWVTIGISILIVGSIVGFYFIQHSAKQSTQPPGQTTPNDAEGFKYPLDTTPLFPPVPPEEDKVYSYSGQIQSIDTSAKKISLQTIRGTRTILYTDVTTYARTVKPTHDQLVQLQPEELAKLMNTEVPYGGGLANGDTITAIAADNIRGHDTITAVHIIIIK